jgi:hypothetical protein
MAVPNNILQNVQTYNLSELAFLQNMGAFIGTSNTRFKNFQNISANLGDTVGFDLPPRMTTTNSLVAAFQPAEQRVHTLTVNKPVSTSIAVTAQQFLFNVHDYMDKFGMAAVREIGTTIEADVASICVSGTYRFFGDGVTPINSVNQLSQALANNREFGVANGETKGYLSNVAIPGIVGTALNQFAPIRNDKLANSWELGAFGGCNWYTSNLLPLHVAGTEGQSGSTLTVVSATYNGPGGSIDSITFSGTDNASDVNSIKQYDKFQFQDGVAGQSNVRFLSFTGHKPTSARVQFQAVANAASTAGSQVTVFINPPLQVIQSNIQNITTPIVPGMQVKVLPSHRSGMITSGNPLFLAMPQLPDMDPFATGNAVDPTTGVSLRTYYGNAFGQNQFGLVHDAIYGYSMPSDYAMAIIFPE